MAIVINPNYELDCVKDDEGKKTWERNFVLRDDGDAEVSATTAYAEAYAYTLANKTYDGLKAKSIKLEQDSDSAARVWRFSVEYTVNGTLGDEDTESNTVVGTLRFNTTGHQSHIISSKATISRTQNNNLGVPAPDFKGLINVQDQSPQGIDITTPCLHVSVTAQVPTRMVTAQWLAVFYNLTGKVNSTPLWAFPAHTLLFRGIDGSSNGAGACNLTFSFDFQPNVTTEVHPFDPVNKNGWEYIWTYSELRTDTTSNTTQPVPVGLYVERVYDEVSFSPFNFIVID